MKNHRHNGGILVVLLLVLIVLAFALYGMNSENREPFLVRNPEAVAIEAVLEEGE